MKSEAEISGAMERLGLSRGEAETVEFIGDGVYASHDGYQVWLQTLEGNHIALEPEVMAALGRYAAQFDGAGK